MIKDSYMITTLYTIYMITMSIKNHPPLDSVTTLMLIELTCPPCIGLQLLSSSQVQTHLVIWHKEPPTPLLTARVLQEVQEVVLGGPPGPLGATIKSLSFVLNCFRKNMSENSKGGFIPHLSKLWHFMAVYTFVYLHSNVYVLVTLSKNLEHLCWVIFSDPF